MSSISVDNITLELTRTEAIDVGQAIKKVLVHTVEEGYKLDINHPGMLELCKNLLNIAYGYNYGRQVDAEIEAASRSKKGNDDENS